jgi:hypothetical protein
LAVLQEQLGTAQMDFLAFLNEAGLNSPFAKGRMQMVATTFRELFEEENGTAISAVPSFIQINASPEISA